MLKISRDSEVNLINILIDQDIISGADLGKIKQASQDGNKSQIDAIFELELTDESKILDLLVKEQNLDIVDLSTQIVSDEIRAVLPSNYINMNFIAPFKIDENVLHIAIPDSSKLSLMRNLKTITKKNIELHAATVSQISNFIELILSEGGEVTAKSISDANKTIEKTKELELKNVKTSCCRAESVKDKYDFVISRAVTNMKDFVSWIKYNVNKKSFNDLKNGVLYLKGGDLKKELISFKNIKTYELSDFFSDDFFNEKKVVYLPIKYKIKN